MIAVFFAMMAALRLARFNLRAQTGEPTTHFTGLPVPAAAGILASFVLSYELFEDGVFSVKTIPLVMKRMPFFFKFVPLDDDPSGVPHGLERAVWEFQADEAGAAQVPAEPGLSARSGSCSFSRTRRT